MVILILIISFMKYQNRLCLIILQDAMTEFEWKNDQNEWMDL